MTRGVGGATLVAVSLEQLQEAIDRSIEAATPLTRQLFGAQPWDAGAVQRFVNRVGAATVATVRRDGRPHVALVIVACLDGTLHFTATPGSVLLRNLERDQRVAITVTDQVHGVMAEGRSRLEGCGDELDGLLQELATTVRRPHFAPPAWAGCVYALVPDRIFTA